MNDRQRENTKKLVAALRSGTYRQTAGSLAELNAEDEVCYCAAGLAAILCMNATQNLEAAHEWAGRVTVPIVIHGDWFRGFLPIGLIEKTFGWTHVQGAELHELNDSLHLTFFQIANMIEQEHLTRCCKKRNTSNQQDTPDTKDKP